MENWVSIFSSETPFCWEASYIARCFIPYCTRNEVIIEASLKMEGPKRDWTIILTCYHCIPMWQCFESYKKNYIYIYQFPILLWKDQISTATNLIFQKSFLCLFGFHLTFNFFKVTSGISKKEACGNLKVFHLQFQICFAPQGKFHLPWMLLRTFLKSTAKYNSVSFFFLLFFVGFCLRDQGVRVVSGIHLLEFIIS